MHLLAEAAELEHNLLCSYLFAMFSLKEDASEDFAGDELATVERWRGEIMSVCVEEMTHLAQVANITVSIGGRPHWGRPNIPISPGYHPASVAVELTRFDLDTLQHFCFLERPDGDAIQDAPSFGGSDAYVRRVHHGNLMPASPNYETIGEFYEVIKSELTAYCSRFGESRLFSGAVDLQMRPEELHTDSLKVIRSLEDAIQAIDDIVREGEGSPANSESSHFAMFTAMRDEYATRTAADPRFDPSRPVGRNPVMHAPISTGRTHVTRPDASRMLDAANGAYGFMLRCLAQCYETDWRARDTRRWLVDGCVAGMKIVSVLGKHLTRLRAADDLACHAGMSFAMLRSLQGWHRPEDALPALRERATEIHDAIGELSLAPETARSAASLLKAWIDRPGMAGDNSVAGTATPA